MRIAAQILLSVSLGLTAWAEEDLCSGLEPGSMTVLDEQTDLRVEKSRPLCFLHGRRLGRLVACERLYKKEATYLCHINPAIAVPFDDEGALSDNTALLLSNQRGAQLVDPKQLLRYPGASLIKISPVAGFSFTVKGRAFSMLGRGSELHIMDALQTTDLGGCAEIAFHNGRVLCDGYAILEY